MRIEKVAVSLGDFRYGESKAYREAFNVWYRIRVFNKLVWRICVARHVTRREMNIIFGYVQILEG